MKFFHWPVWLVLVTGLLPACHSPAPQHKQDTYFSLPEYFSEQIPLIAAQYHQASKIVTANGISDSVQVKLDTLQLKDYFQPFISLDINKPALRDTYHIEHFTDSTSGHLSVIYTSTGSNTRPYQVCLDINGRQEISSIYMVSSTRNMLYSTSRKMLYQAGRFIQIITEQKMILFAPKEMQVKIIFEK